MYVKPAFKKENTTEAGKVAPEAANSRLKKYTGYHFIANRAILIILQYYAILPSVIRMKVKDDRF
jgi:hypothetical protein